MIIQLRGLSGSGKSTIVRNVLNSFPSMPIFGALGPKMPEAYSVWPPFTPPSKSFHILGPYNISHEGVDWITKKMDFHQFVDVLEHYAARGNVLFESLRFSNRWREPTMGGWLRDNQNRCLLAVLDVPYDVVQASIAQRQRDLGRYVKEQKHAEAERRMFENATEYAWEAGMRIEYVTRENAVEKIIGWLQ